ncbi:hypothetical protein BFJ63_vAg7993 [Fusarium oxysporum f. sp. narcissi]|uniref:Uncharacterized protein n=2 Tax=Fusarium oxysporum TaxID=5507 RepID=A0A4Q2VRA7_FUSOX|nr:hypothetical protein BFJ65_g1600 [Fusarium oxysporum f. sp. cepae]RKK35472.1 hypothetical protein BFJ67_g13266 [Fusarium oxysporum f. sp. cepae]RKK37488.1 hypothetical protein BFJ66_g12958 [Fusarium oxysporum f. sp. cepae]RKL14101.1 hypothetical protein BFJ70_g15763 [Fusarium oxysporum]RYC89222.1 hypothetical protein BFJ63_vAg7993 [Fusarium oxysporum f. sp. narcissi]
MLTLDLPPSTPASASAPTAASAPPGKTAANRTPLGCRLVDKICDAATGGGDHQFYALRCSCCSSKEAPDERDFFHILHEVPLRLSNGFMEG